MKTLAATMFVTALIATLALADAVPTAPAVTPVAQTTVKVTAKKKRAPHPRRHAHPKAATTGTGAKTANQ